MKSILRLYVIAEKKLFEKYCVEIHREIGMSILCDRGGMGKEILVYCILASISFFIEFQTKQTKGKIYDAFIKVIVNEFGTREKTFFLKIYVVSPTFVVIS